MYVCIIVIIGVFMFVTFPSLIDSHELMDFNHAKDVAPQLDVALL